MSIKSSYLMIIKNKGERKEKKRKKYYEAVEELEVDGIIAAVETGRVAKGVEERLELFVGGSMVEARSRWQSSVS